MNFSKATCSFFKIVQIWLKVIHLWINIVSWVATVTFKPCLSESGTPFPLPQRAPNSLESKFVEAPSPACRHLVRKHTCSSSSSPFWRAVSDSTGCRIVVLPRLSVDYSPAWTMCVFPGAVDWAEFCLLVNVFDLYFWDYVYVRVMPSQLAPFLFPFLPSLKSFLLHLLSLRLGPLFKLYQFCLVKHKR